MHKETECEYIKLYDIYDYFSLFLFQINFIDKSGTMKPLCNM